MSSKDEVKDFDFAGTIETPKDGVKDFDFANMTKERDIDIKASLEEEKYHVEKEAEEKEEDDDLTKEIKKLKKQIATSGSLTPAIIKEARELAESKKGLDIDKFMQKHRLINIDIEQMLHAPLKKNGSFA